MFFHILIFTLFLSPDLFFFFFNDTATTEIYTLSLHDALPILAEQLEAAGHPLEGFTRRYRTYQQHQKQIEADPERPTGFAQAIGKGSGRVLNEVEIGRAHV